MMQTEQPTFADLCREQREQRHWTQQEMADAIGIGLRQYQRWEYGEARPRAAEARQFAEVFKMPVDVVFEILAAEKAVRKP